MSRRAFLKAVAGLGSVALLAACGGGGAAPATDNVANSATAPSSASASSASAVKGSVAVSSSTAKASSAAAPEETIEYWHINTPAFGLPAVEELVAKFNEKHSEIAVTHKFQQGFYTGLTQNLQAAVAAKRPPAVAQIGYNYVRYISENFPVVALDKVAGGELKDFLQRYPDNLVKLAQNKDVVWGAPYGLSDPVTYVNPELLQAAGLNPEKAPATWEEVQQAAQVVKSRTGKYGVHPQLVDNWMTQAMIEGRGGRMLTENGSCMAFNSPEAQAAIQFWRDLIKDGLAPQATDEEAFPSFTAGNIAMTMTTPARRSTFEKQAKFAFKLAPFPEFRGYPRRLPSGGNVLMVFTQDPKKQKAAWEFLKFMTSPAAITIWVKGTGYVSPIKGTEDDPRYLGNLFKEFPTMKVPYDQVKDIVPWVNYPGPRGLQVEQILLDARNAALLGKTDVKAALDGAMAKANELVGGCQ